MDASLFRIVNRFADRTGWLHPLAVAFAKCPLIRSDGGDHERA
ncbi:MAG: hypothetical protein ACT452_03000 [Microthrixaceae bacterium]